MTAVADRRWPPAWSAGLVDDEVAPDELLLALEAAGWPGDLAPAQRRAFALLILASCEARREGSTRLALDEGLADRLAALGAPSTDRVATLALARARLEHPALTPLVGRPGDWRPFIVDGAHLYRERDLRLEQRVADALADRLAEPASGAPALLPPAAVGRTWTAGQAAAIAAALTRRLTVVTGGPGSGKTAVIGGIVRAWRAAGVAGDAIAVAAPTGKAANRAAEALAAENADVSAPSTLHRLLGYAPRPRLRGGEVRHHQNNPLPHQAVVVDEASMVDLALLDQLLRALPAEARLVLVGDAGQLPAIAAGSVFRDLASVPATSARSSVVSLVESHRMSPADPSGAEILGVARAVAAGVPPLTPPVSDPAALVFAGFEHLDPGDGPHGRRAIAAFLERWYVEQIRLPAELDAGRPLGAPAGVLDAESSARAGALLDRHRRARLLTVTRVGRAGADRINDEMARRAAAESTTRPQSDVLPAGTPVMVVENDYDRGLMNGDQGIVLPVADERGKVVLMTVFSRAPSFALFPLATLRGLVQIAYAVTVHKAQGSEVDRAALLLPEADLPMLSRELIYTAATRARSSMVLVGRPALLVQAIARPLGQTSGLGQRLADRLAPAR